MCFGKEDLSGLIMVSVVFSIVCPAAFGRYGLLHAVIHTDHQSGMKTNKRRCFFNEIGSTFKSHSDKSTSKLKVFVLRPTT